MRSGNVLSVSVLFTFVILTLLEIILRQPFIEAILPRPDYGTNNTELGIKISQLDNHVKQFGSIDCLFMGSSVMDSNGDSSAFSEAYFQTTGSTIDCYNFALAGLPPSSASTAARFLIERYQPNTIIYAVGAFEFTEWFNEDKSYDLPWIQQSLGNSSLSGWFIDTFHVARYFSSLRFYTDFEYRSIYSRFSEHLNDAGQDIQSDIYTYQPTEQLEWPDYKYQVSIGLKFDTFLELAATTDTQIILVEEPVHPEYFLHGYLGGAEIYEQEFLEPIEKLAAAKNILVIRVQSEEVQIPPDGWLDPKHLNKNGAPVFNAWLGSKVGELVNQGKLAEIK